MYICNFVKVLKIIFTSYLKSWISKGHNSFGSNALIYATLLCVAAIAQLVPNIFPPTNLLSPLAQHANNHSNTETKIEKSINFEQRHHCCVKKEKKSHFSYHFKQASS